MHRIIRSLFIFVAVVLLATPFPVMGQEGPIVVGQSCALSGPARNLGLGMQAGLLAAFAQINEDGGVKDRKLQLISLDDSYEPDRAVANTIRLINEYQVFLLIGEVGTPTSRAVLPLIERYKIPFFAPFTGDELLRNPFNPLIINVRPSYYQEMEAISRYLVEKKGLKRIACFYQNDTYGFAGLMGLKSALERRGMSLVAQGSYERNTVAVMGALKKIAAQQPDAIVMVGAYSSCAEFIKLYKTKVRTNPIFCNISFVGTESLAHELGNYGTDVIVSQVVPDPMTETLPIAKEYRKAMDRYQHDSPISFTSFEGYIAGRLFAKVIETMNEKLTRENFIKTLEQIKTFNIGGLIIQFGENEHQGLDEIYLTTIYPSIHMLQD